MKTPIEILLRANGLRPTSQRRLIVGVISEAGVYLDFADLYRRLAERNCRVSRATVYKTLKVLTAKGMIECHAFRDGRSRFRPVGSEHRDQLIDLATGAIAEFVDPQIERLLKRIARQLGYRLVDHRFELYAIPLPREAPANHHPRAPELAQSTTAEPRGF